MLPMCVYARCTAPAICQHSVVTSVEGGTHRLGVCECVCIREKRKKERDFRALYACHISYSCLFLSPVHLYGCDRSHYGFGTASARLANAAFRDGIFNVCACSASRVHAHARPHHQLLPLSAVTNMTETIALIICTPIAQFEHVNGDAVSC